MPSPKSCSEMNKNSNADKNTDYEQFPY